MNEKLVEAMARAIRGEIIKGWDFPLTTTPENQAEDAAHAALRAMTEGEVFEEIVELAARSLARDFNGEPEEECLWEDWVDEATAALRAALGDQS